jgi:hypothetical protein
MLDEFEREVRRRERAACALRKMLGGDDGELHEPDAHVKVEQPSQEVR